MLWKSSVILHIVGVNKPASEFLVNYGVTDALSAFPLHSLVSTMTATINNNTVSMNVQETLPTLLRLLDDEEICNYDDMTPTTLDYLANYADAVDRMPFVIDTIAATGLVGALAPAADELAPTAVAAGRRPTSYVSYPSKVLGHDLNRSVCQRNCPRPRGSWKVKGIWGGALATPRALGIADTGAV